MNAKGIVRAVLLLFVGYSLVVVVAKRFVAEPSGEAPGEAVAADAPATPAGAAPEPSAPKPAKNRIVVYFFHDRDRCENCRNLEAYAKEAVHTAFGDQIAAGTTEWLVVDLSQPKDAHFDKDFKLGRVSSVVVAEIRDGKHTRWRLLEDGLMLAVTGTRGEVIDYVQREVRAFIKP